MVAVVVKVLPVLVLYVEKDPLIDAHMMGNTIVVNTMQMLGTITIKSDDDRNNSTNSFVVIYLEGLIDNPSD